MTPTNPLAPTDSPATDAAAPQQPSVPLLDCDGASNAESSLADALERCVDRWMADHQPGERCVSEESCCRSALTHALERPRLRSLFASALAGPEALPHDVFRSDLPQTVTLDDDTIRVIEAMRTATIEEPDLPDATLEFEYQR